MGGSISNFYDKIATYLDSKTTTDSRTAMGVVSGTRPCLIELSYVNYTTCLSNRNVHNGIESPVTIKVTI